MKTYWHRRANISIGTVTTLEPGSDATASVTEDNVLSLGIPQGAQGEQGIQGPPMTYSDMSAADKSALSSDVADSLPYASQNDFGVVKIGAGLAVTDGVISATGNIEPISTMTGANGTTAGAGGTVPAPAATDNVKYLRGDATWADPTPANATTSAAGLMSAADKTKLDGIATQATKGSITQLYSHSWTSGDTYDGAEIYRSTSLMDYDLLICEYVLAPAAERNAVVIPTAFYKARANTGGANSYLFLQSVALQMLSTSSVSKHAIRKMSLVAYYTSQTLTGIGVEFSSGYYNGSKNNGYILPVGLYGVKL